MPTWLWVKTNGTIFGVGAPPILVHLSVDWDVHWGYGILTHGHLDKPALAEAHRTAPWI